MPQQDVGQIGSSPFDMNGGGELPFNASQNGITQDVAMQYMPYMGNEEGEEQFDSNFDAGVDADENQDPKKFIQQLAGKLSQSLRTYNNELPKPDADLNKYVAGMVNKQATEGLTQDDIDEIMSKIKADETENMDDSSEGQDEQESSGNMPMPESMIRENRIDELFQEIMNDDDEKEEYTNGKPIGHISFCKMPFTAPKFK